MNAPGFLQDFAVVMLVAGAVTLLFQRLRQPVVLGYLIAGFIIGPFSPPFELVRDPATIRTMADLGVVILMFCLGLEFNLRKLQDIGRPALVVAAIEITVMLLVGYELGLALGWPPADRVLLGILLALTSTTIVVKSLRDRGELDQPHGRMIAGVAIYDDIFVILVMVLLPGFAQTGTLPTGELAWVLLKLFVFLVAVVVTGLLALPRLIRFAARFQSDEMLLVLALGLGFGMALLGVTFGFSAALGAFLMGGLLAASGEGPRLSRLLGPVRDMFSAIFFITIGMLIDPHQVATHGSTVLIILAVYLPAKVLACALGALVAGSNGREALRVGTGMAQVGEFAFVLAAISVSLGLASAHLSPVIVSVATLNAFVRPYVVDHVDRLADRLRPLIPAPLRAGLAFYRAWLAAPRATNRLHAARRVLRSVIWQIALNLALMASFFVVAAIAARWLPETLVPIPERWGGRRTLCWLAALLAASPILVATLRKMQAVAMMMSELTIPSASRHRNAARAILTHTLFTVGSGALVLLIVAVSTPLLPPLKILLVAAVPVGFVLYRYGHVMNRLYSRAKFAVVETWGRDPDSGSAIHAYEPIVPGTRIETIPLPHDWHERSLRELGLRSRSGATVVSIERKGGPVVNPPADTRVRSDDRLVLLGTPEQIAQARVCLTQSGGDTA